jgi:hypothetical protein
MKDGTWQNDGLIVGGAFRAGAAKKRGKTSQLLHLALKFGRQAPKTLVYPAVLELVSLAKGSNGMEKWRNSVNQASSFVLAAPKTDSTVLPGSAIHRDSNVALVNQVASIVWRPGWR